MIPFAWLSQIAFAEVYRVGGWKLLYAFDSIIWALGFLVVAQSAKRTFPSTGAVVVALALGFTVSVPFSSLRPQSFAILCFGLLLALLRSSLSTRKKVCLAVPLCILWHNLHPSASIAAASAFGAAAVRWLCVLRNPHYPKPWADTWVGGIAVLSCLITPAGIKGIKTSARNAEISRQLGVNEWLPIWDSKNVVDAFPVWIAIAATGFMIATRKRLPAIADVGRIIAPGLMMLAAYRFAPFWALAMIPVWAAALAETAAAGPKKSHAATARSTFYGIFFVLFGVLSASLLRADLFASYLPLEGVNRLQSENVSGTIYCHPAWGGPLIEKGYPNWQVSYDGRYYVYSWEEWQEYRMAATGERPLADIIRQHNPSAFFLHPFMEGALVRQLRHVHDWIEVYSDSNCLIFMPRKNRQLAEQKLAQESTRW